MWLPMKPAPPATQMTEAIFSTPLDEDRIASAQLVTRWFFRRRTEEVARDLLGKILVRSSPDGIVALRANEVEAYLGPEDPACHTWGGRRTGRVASMWGEAGHAYVYLIYGIHHCLNVVTVGPGVGEAVLVRGGVPVAGLALIRRRRGAGVREASLCDGPGKLCQALAITRDEDGLDLCRPEAALRVCDDGLQVHEGSVQRLPRVGVGYAGEAAAWPLRFAYREGG
jgi:DNA-3-methyladenine glycosylase